MLYVRCEATCGISRRPRITQRPSLTIGPIPVGRGPICSNNNGGCQEICSVDNLGQRECSCFDGRILSHDRLTCYSPTQPTNHPNTLWWLPIPIIIPLLIIIIIIIAIVCVMKGGPRRRASVPHIHLPSITESMGHAFSTAFWPSFSGTDLPSTSVNPNPRHNRSFRKHSTMTHANHAYEK
uniref:EGF-like domain-containing protein n=1 Tax=Ciona savignyi TaxID=51511 RepID=H2ZJA8_CIOSA